MKGTLFLQVMGVTALWMTPLFFAVWSIAHERGKKAGHAEGVKEGFLDGRRSERRYQE